MSIVYASFIVSFHGLKVDGDGLARLKQSLTAVATDLHVALDLHDPRDPCPSTDVELDETAGGP